MGRFVETAADLLEAAEAASRATSNPTEMTILLSAEGGIRLVANSDWPLDSLAAHHGAEMAYRVHQRNDVIRLEGRAGHRKCLFESPRMPAIARELLGSRPVLLPAETEPTPRAVWG